MFPLTSALWLQVAVDRRRQGFDLDPTGSVYGVPPERRGEGSDGSQGGVTETHVGRWGHLPPQRRQVSCGRGGMKGERRGDRGHGDVVTVLVMDGVVIGGRWRHPGCREEEN